MHGWRPPSAETKGVRLITVEWGMPVEKIDTLVVGGGQAGIAMSEHLSVNGVPHLVLERNRVAERWRSARWDSLVMNGPAWHDRFPGLTFGDVDKSVRPDDFPLKDTVADYLVAYAKKIAAPVRCGVEVLKVDRKVGQRGFRVETSTGAIEADRVVAATGAFQRPNVPAMVPAETGVLQMHSTAYRNPRASGRADPQGHAEYAPAHRGSRRQDGASRQDRGVHHRYSPPRSRVPHDGRIHQRRASGFNGPRGPGAGPTRVAGRNRRHGRHSGLNAGANVGANGNLFHDLLAGRALSRNRYVRHRGSLVVAGGRCPLCLCPGRCRRRGLTECDGPFAWSARSRPHAERHERRGCDRGNPEARPVHGLSAVARGRSAGSDGHSFRTKLPRHLGASPCRRRRFWRQSAGQ